MTDTYQSSFAGALEEIAEAYERVPFFKGHMDAAGLRPGSVTTPADFRRIPATSKVDYRRNFPAGVLVRGAALSDPFVFRSQSSGTTGERLLTIAHSYTLAERMTTTATVNPGLSGVFSGATEQRICRFAAPNCSDVECATPFTTPESRTLPDGTRVLPVAHDLLSTPDSMIDQAVDEIVDYRPHWLYTDPMHMAFLARNLKARNIAPPPAGGVVLTYNLVTRSARRQVAEAYGTDQPVLAEVVSMSELGWMGMECPHGFVHMNTDSFYLEFLVGDRPAEPGELAEMYVTSIGDEISPHLRYRTGDLFTLLDGRCPCGHCYPRVEFHGRGTHLVMRHGEPVLTPHHLDELIGPAEWLAAYKLRQLDEDRVRLRYIPSHSAEPTHPPELADRLRAALGPDIAVDIEPVGYIECERSGKFLCCVSEVPR
jgi:phenylacetate-CoA ligase